MNCNLNCVILQFIEYQGGKASLSLINPMAINSIHLVKIVEKLGNFSQTLLKMFLVVITLKL